MRVDSAALTAHLQRLQDFVRRQQRVGRVVGTRLWRQRVQPLVDRWHKGAERVLSALPEGLRPRSDMDHRALIVTILVSALLHVGVLAYVALTWGFVPTALAEPEPRVVAMAAPPPPPPPPPPEVTDVEIERPRFRPRPVPPPPEPVKHVKPIPMKPQPPAKSTADATTLVAEKPAPPDPPPVSTTPPRAASKPPPTYPPRALDAEKEGSVKVAITIQPDGHVSDADVVAARPSGWFESAALAAVRRWRYEASGRVSKTVVEIEFKLD